MWPFKKKKQPAKKEKIKIQTLIMIRYTYDAWQKLFPDSNKEKWEELNCPDNVAEFVKQSIKRSSNVKHPDGSVGMPDFESALITTLDEQYLSWLERNNYSHSQENLGKYLEEYANNEDYWNECLNRSEMTTTYNVMGIPFSMLLHDINGKKSEYCLREESARQIEPILSAIYQSEEVFVPGWILRGADMPKCVNSVVEFAKLYLREKRKIRFGKFLEQTYTEDELKDKFKPYNYLLPFVVKSKIEKALISFRKYDINSKNTHNMIQIKFKENEKEQLKDILIASDPHVIAVGNSAMMPGQAYLANALKIQFSNN